MSENELDAQEIAAYRRALDFAAEVHAGKLSPREVIRAGDALFAALARRDDRAREMIEIVRAVASYSAQPLPDEWVRRARRVIGVEVKG